MCDGSDGELLQACSPPQDHQVQARLGRVALHMESRDTSAGIDSTSFRIRIWIRIHRIHMFLGLPDPDQLVRGMDPDLAPDPDPFIIKQKK